MDAAHYAIRAKVMTALEAAKSDFSDPEYHQLIQATERLSRHALVTLKEIAPSPEADQSWVPITDVVGDDDRPDDMTA